MFLRLACCTLAACLLTGCESRVRQSTTSGQSSSSGQPVDHSNEDVVIAEDSAVVIESPPSITATKTQQRPDPVQLQREATIALDAGEEDRAFELAREVLRLTPGDPASVFLMARLLGQRHRFPEAIRMLDRLAETTPEARLPILGQTAQWMVRFGQWSEAEARYRKILDVVPEAVMVHRNLAQLYVRQGRGIQAAEHLNLLCRAGDIEEIELRHLLSIGHPFAGDALLEELSPIGDRGVATNKIGQGDWTGARTYLEGLDPIEPNASMLLGRVYAKLNDMDSLESWVAALPPYDLEHPDVWFAKGALAAQRGNHADAVRNFCEVVLRDPTDTNAYEQLSQSLVHVGALKESQSAADRARSIALTQTLGAEMAESVERDDETLSSLIDTLDQLQRPREALGWCGVRLSYGQSTRSLSDSELAALSQSIRERAARLSDVNAHATREFLICGVDFEKHASQTLDNIPTESKP